MSTGGYEKLIVGGGVAGMLEAYYALKEVEESGRPVDITILEKNFKLDQTTAMNISPSLTPDEMVAVIPAGEDLDAGLATPFNQDGGMKVMDVPALNKSSKDVKGFLSSSKAFSKGQKGGQERRNILLVSGRQSMTQWDEMFLEDNELSRIMEASNYKACKEIPYGEMRLGQGYRVDIFRDHLDADCAARSMAKDYQSLGYLGSRVLSPDEIMAIDPQLMDFAENYSFKKGGDRVWKKGANAIWRPGGSLDANHFMFMLMYCLKSKAKKMNNGSSVNILLGHEVVGVELGSEGRITGLNVEVENGGGKVHKRFPEEQRESSDLEVVFAPGASVGTLRKFGFEEPDAAIFAGVSLHLKVPLDGEMKDKYRSLNHTMEVHQRGVVLAWQAKNTNDTVRIGVAGTKAFYGDVMPKLDEEFAKNRLLFQLNAIYALYPKIVDVALARKGENGPLSQVDLDELIAKKMARVWVGGRSVAYDGFPTLGSIYKGDRRITNGRVITHLGSGGVSFGPAAIRMSKAFVKGGESRDGSTELYETVREFSDSRRKVNDIFKPDRRKQLSLRSLKTVCKIVGLFGRVRCVGR